MTLAFVRAPSLSPLSRGTTVAAMANNRFDDGMLPITFPFLVTLGLCAGGYLLSMVLGAK